MSTTCDVVVVGSGAAGFTAALTAAGHGAHTIVLERAAELGGTTRKSAAYFWIPNNRFMRAAGIEDPRPQALRYMARLSRPDRYQADAPTLGLPAWEYEALATFYDHGPAAMEFLESLGAMEGGAAEGYPDYFAHLPEDAAPTGRTMWPAEAEGGQAGGRLLIERFARTAAGLGIEVRTGHRVDGLVRAADGEVVGVTATTDEGEQVEIGARRGVVFASGGFTQDAALRAGHLEGPYVGGCAAPTNTGDFVRIATGAGAQLANMQYAWGGPIVLERLLRDPASVACSFVLPGDGLVVVNRAGERVVNEKIPYNEQVRAFFAWDAATATYPNLPLIAIWDAQVAAQVAGVDFGNPIPPPDVDGYWVIEAADLDALADGIEDRLGRLAGMLGEQRLAAGFVPRLRATLDRFGTMADRGVDEDFARGETPIELAVTAAFGPGDGPNPTMRRLASSGPYFATILGPGTLDTKGGPRVDLHGRVLDHGADPIPGLYGAGNCVASPAAQAYWGAGGTIGPILCFAHLAGLHVASRVAATV
jgi:3-oxosteroid 1-dehydrogenase